MTGVFDGIQTMLNKRRGGHVQSRGRALKSFTKEKESNLLLQMWVIAVITEQDHFASLIAKQEVHQPSVVLLGYHSDHPHL